MFDLEIGQLVNLSDGKYAVFKRKTDNKGKVSTKISYEDAPVVEGPICVGVDTFTYRANDGSSDLNLATVTIDVNPGAVLQYTSSTGSFALSPGETITVTVDAVSAPYDVTRFQLDFAGAAIATGGLILDSWTTNTTAWPQVTDPGLNTNSTDTRVAAENVTAQQLSTTLGNC